MFFILLPDGEIDINKRITEFAEKDYNNLKKYCKARLCTKGIFSFDSAESESEKIVQDCFLLLCEKTRDVKISNIKAWMYRTADVLIKKETRLRAIDLKFLYDNDTVFDSLSGNDTYDDIGYDFIDSLDESDREKIELYYGKRKTLEELACDMGIKPDTLRKRKSRFEMALKNKFKDYLEKNG